jgi:hypothetical protein
MKHQVINRPELTAATLRLGGQPLSLAPYATTGLLGVAVGPRGMGKTNAGLLIAEQLSAQGWVSVLIDPESELESLYGDAVKDADDLERRLTARREPILVVRALDAKQFVPYGQAVLRVSEAMRKPVYLCADEGQLFSSTRKRSQGVGEAADILNTICERGRKRALDLFITALRYTGTLHRSIFANKNLTFVGCQEDPTVWASLAPQFKGTQIEFSDLQALAPGEFVMFSRRGVEKVRMPMAEALKPVATKAEPPKRALPSTYSQWARAMRELPLATLQRLDDDVVGVLGSVAGLSAHQVVAGTNALRDELEARA